MKKWSWLFMLALLSAVASGCAAAAISQVQVNGYTDSAAPAPFAPGTSFFVIESKEAQNPLLEKEITAKINRLLANRGFSLAPYEPAAYYLLFTYGMGSPQAASVATPSVGVGIGMGVGSSRWGGGYGFFWPGYPPYYVETQPLYDRWLRLTVVEGKYYRETGKSRPVWVGEVRSTGTSSDFREVINSLLIAAFEQFGKNTGKALPAEVSRNDPQYKELEGVR